MVSTNTKALQRDKVAKYGERSFELIVSEVFTSRKPRMFSYELQNVFHIYIPNWYQQFWQ